MAQGKPYSDDGPFQEPVVRCNECRKLLLMEDLLKTGLCKYCGCRKVSKVKMLDGEDLATVKKWSVDPEWLALFEESPND